MLYHKYFASFSPAPCAFKGSVQDGACQILACPAEVLVGYAKLNAFVKDCATKKFAQFNAFVALANIAATAVALSLSLSLSLSLENGRFRRFQILKTLT